MNHSYTYMAFALFLTACGGGSDGGSSGGDTPPSGSGNSGADPDSPVSTRAQDLSFVASEVSVRAVAAENSPIIASTSVPSNGGLQKSGEPISMSSTETVDGECGGSSTVVVDAPENAENELPIESSFDITYNNFCIYLDGTTSIVFNGSAEAEIVIDAEYSLFAYDYDLTYSSDNALVGSGVISASERCETFGGADALPICTSTSSFEYSDGNEYTLTDADISGDASMGYSFEGEVGIEGEDEGTFSISVDAITLCENGNIGSGSITITDDDETITVTFPNCDEMVITYDGVSDTFSQL